MKANALLTTLSRACVSGLACTLLAAATPVLAQEAAEGGSTRPANRTDFIDAAYLPGLNRVVVAGHYGLVGLIEVGENAATMQIVENVPSTDYTALASIADDAVLIGTSTGRVYRFDGSSMTEIAALSEYDEPVLDIAAEGDTVWVVGARGLVARRVGGGEFENVEISNVLMPLTRFPGSRPADWYFGVSNVDPETIEFSATVGGEPAVADEHYVMFPDEGFVQFQTEIDNDPPPAISFRFSPGPPFRTGDVSWNVVLIEDGTVTLAGEFGMILQSEDNGETWVRRDSEIVAGEPEPAYWMAGMQRGDRIWLTGAAGVSQRSNDGGETWVDNPKPGREGIFGVTFTEQGSPLIAGAVGLIGFLENNKWQIADRTRLRLLSWLKTPVTLPDGSVLVMGGRATAIRYVDGDFQRIPVKF